jgi:hypothetical protein
MIQEGDYVELSKWTKQDTNIGSAIAKVIKREGEEVWLEGIQFNDYADGLVLQHTHIIKKLPLSRIIKGQYTWYTNNEKAILTAVSTRPETAKEDSSF